MLKETRTPLSTRNWTSIRKVCETDPDTELTTDGDRRHTSVESIFCEDEIKFMEYPVLTLNRRRITTKIR